PKKGSFIIAANHSSYFDFIFLYVFIPRRITFLAAEKFFASRFWRPFMKITGQIKVDRGSGDKGGVYEQVDELISKNGVLGIFPEGTRSRSGKIQKAYSGVAKFANKYNIPIVPVGISGTYEIMSPHDNFPKFKKGKINIGASLIVDSDDYEGETRKIMKTISALAGQSYEF
ncbi:MAG: lysophospholipid acyltransferase family protein, partial [Patescibacteria group bacterium]